MKYLEPYRRRRSHEGKVRALRAVELRDSGLLLKQVAGVLDCGTPGRASQLVTRGRELIAAGWRP